MSLGRYPTLTKVRVVPGPSSVNTVSYSGFGVRGENAFATNRAATPVTCESGQTGIYYHDQRLPSRQLEAHRQKEEVAKSTLCDGKKHLRAMSFDETRSQPSPMNRPTVRNRPRRSHRDSTRRVYGDEASLERLVSLDLQVSSHRYANQYELPPPPTSPIRSRSYNSLKRFWVSPFWSGLRPSRLRSASTAYLALYFAFNLGLTLYNKSLLIHFPFPYTLSAIHALCGSIGSFILVRTGYSTLPSLSARQKLVILAFSVLYTVNIIVSNVSLGLVTVPESHRLRYFFHQVVRASTPLFTIFFSAILLGARSSREKLVALIPVILGVGFATYGDYYFTLWGFILTLFGTMLAALKTIYTNVLQSPSFSSQWPLRHPAPKDVSVDAQVDSKARPILTSLHLLHILSPLAFVQTTLIAHITGELDLVRDHFVSQLYLGPPRTGYLSSRDVVSTNHLILLFLNGVVAFGLNVVSFTANRKVGPLSMTVAANVKQVLTIIIAVALFHLKITPTNALGIVLTLFGGAIYTAVEFRERTATTMRC